MATPLERIESQQTRQIVYCDKRCALRVVPIGSPEHPGANPRCAVIIVSDGEKDMAAANTGTWIRVRQIKNLNIKGVVKLCRHYQEDTGNAGHCLLHWNQCKERYRRCIDGPYEQQPISPCSHLEVNLSKLMHRFEPADNVQLPLFR